jgi:DNA-directed RNA polymerase subunit F
VQPKTLEDPKGVYEWTPPEKAMMERCLQNRRERYLVDPSKIVGIRDKRYTTPYPPIREDDAVLNTPTFQDSPMEETPSLEGRRVIAITQYNKDGTVDKRTGVHAGRVVLNTDSNAKYKYKIVYDNPKVEAEEWDGEEDDEIKLEPLNPNAVYSISDANSWLASRKNAAASKIGYMGAAKRLALWLKEEDFQKILNMDIKTLERSIKSNPRWKEPGTVTSYIQTLMIISGDPKLSGHIHKNRTRELEMLYREWKNKSDAELVKRPRKTNLTLYETLEPSFRNQSIGTLESALGALLSLGIYDKNRKLTMIPRIDNVYRGMRFAKSSAQIDRNKKCNWYVMSTGRLVVGEFKTNNSKPEYDYVMLPEVKKVVNAYLKKREPSTYLFENSVGNILGPNELSDYSASIFGSNLKTQKYRTLIYNYFEKVVKMDPESLSKAMGHAVTTGQTKYADRDGRHS